MGYHGVMGACAFGCIKTAFIGRRVPYRIGGEIYMTDAKRDVTETLMDGYAQKDGAMQPEEGDDFYDADDIG